MEKLLSFLVAAVYVVVGTPALFLYYLDSQWNGTDQRALAILFALAVYIYGVAAVALWNALKPFSHGLPILLALCSPAVLYIGFAIIYSVVFTADEKMRDLQRVAEAGEIWEEWPVPEEAHGVPFLVEGRMLIATTDGVFESRDTARTWTKIAGRFGRWGVQSWTRIGTSLFATTSRELFRSDDGGRSWVMLGVPGNKGDSVYWTDAEGAPRSEAITSLTAAGTDLYMHSYKQVFRSSDLGESWTLAYHPERYMLDARSFLVSGDTLLVGTHVAGLLRSLDSGETWTALEGFPHPLVPALAKDGRTLYAVGHADRSNRAEGKIDVLRSSDDGESWTVVNDGLKGDPDDFVGPVGGRMLLLTGLGVFSIEPGDAAWSTLPLPGPALFAVPHATGPHFGASEEQLFRLNPDGKLFHLREPQ